MPAKTKKQLSEALDEAQIIAALNAHPDFFARHPDSLATLDLPVISGQAISLHQYQVRIMREEQQQLKQKLAALVKNVKTNHKIHSDLLDLAGNIIQLTKQNADLETQLRAISNYFALFDIKLVLKKENTNQFVELKKTLGKQDSYCSNTPDTALLESLFTDSAPAVLSIAIVPVKQKNKNRGFLVLAADDAERFKSNMGGEFLKLLARLVSNLCNEPAKRH